MIGYIYKRTFNIFKTIPVKLWGISLLSGFLTLLAILFGVLPIVIIPVTAALIAGMSVVYLDGYRGSSTDTGRLFSGFKNFTHTAGGMCWKNLWLLLWALIPIAGIVLYFVKSLSYAFVPYILVEEDSVSAMAALKRSMQDTKGLKRYMFLAILLPTVIFMLVTVILGALAMIPFVGVVFSVIGAVVSLAYSVISPLFFGLVKAGFYEYATGSRVSHKYTAPARGTGESIACPTCEAQNAAGSMFCYKCGAKLK